MYKTMDLFSHIYYVQVNKNLAIFKILFLLVYIYILYCEQMSRRA